MTNPEPTRRIALAAIGTVGALAAAPMAVAATVNVRSTPSSATWERALADFNSAQKAMDDYHRDVLEPAIERYTAVRSRFPMRLDLANIDAEGRAAIERASAIYQPFEERFDELVSAQFAALTHLIYTPVPTVKALAVKMQLAGRHEVHDCTDCAGMIAAMIQDATRLAKREG